MALIKCPECGRDVSSSAKSCIHCGCPISGGQQDFKINEEEAKRYQVNEKKSKGKKTAGIVIPIVVCVLGLIGMLEENRLQHESAREQAQSEQAQETSGSVKEQVPSGSATEESLEAQEDKEVNTDISIPEITDALILQDRFLMENTDAGDSYLTVYYGKDSGTVKELLYELFILKDAVSEYIDPENYDFSDFETFSESFKAQSGESVQDIGNYYLLSIDYTDLDDADEVSAMVQAGMLEWSEEGDHTGDLIDASFYMDSLEKSGYEKGYFADKEYASFFGSGREAAQ